MIAIGCAVLAVVGIALTIALSYSGWGHLPMLFRAATVVAMIVGIGLTIWGIRDRSNANGAPPGSAFIRGPVTGSAITDATSEAHTFVEGSVEHSFLSRIMHRPNR